MKKKILFICIENACRSQMAEGFANHYGKGNIVAYSAGSKPSGVVEPLAIKVMKEIDINISSHKSKGFNELLIHNFDYVVTMGCKDVCPFYPAVESYEWDIEDPKGKSIDVFRKVRDEIEGKVLNLMKTVSLDMRPTKTDNRRER